MKRRILIAIILTLIVIAANARQNEGKGKPNGTKEISDLKKRTCKRAVI